MKNYKHLPQIIKLYSVFWWIIAYQKLLSWYFIPVLTNTHKKTSPALYRAHIRNSYSTTAIPRERFHFLFFFIRKYSRGVQPI